MPRAISDLQNLSLADPKVLKVIPWNEAGVYQIKNLANGKVYVGSTVKLRRRIKDHLRELSGERHHSPYLQRSWKKYGPENFVVSVLEIVEGATKETLIPREQHWIDHFGAANKKTGFNVLPMAYSNLGAKLSEETKAKIRLANINRPPPTLEQRKQISEALKGRKRPPHIGEAVRKAKLGKPGRKQAQWEKEYHRERAKRMWEDGTFQPTQQKDWCITNPQGEQFIINNLVTFCRENNLSYSGMISVSRGEQINHRGWLCHRADKPEPTRPTEYKKTGRKPTPGTITSPAGEKIFITDTQKFCAEHSLLYAAIRDVLTGARWEHKGWTCPEKWGTRPPRTNKKAYIITHPDGTEEEIFGLSEFCRKHNLATGNMNKVLRGKISQHKGFKVRYQE